MSNKIRPFSHQQEAFDVVAKERKSLYMIAGTASGKTLAVGLPLFHLLKQGEIRRVLLMYPTLALLDDQRRVMNKLAKVTGVTAAEIKGGMTRSELVSALNSHVILATPDAIYWFFRKNVKFSSLLIYGLAQVDAVVLDEAHLFNGLSLRGMALLKERISLLAQQLNKNQQWHILTATPHADLYALTTNGVEVRGKSKCGSVGLDLLEPGDSMADGRSQMRSAVSKALEEGAKKVLLVFNSAAEAHTTFHRYQDNKPDLPLQLKKKYGRVWLTALQNWMTEMGIAQEVIRQIRASIPAYADVHLCDLDREGNVTLKNDDLMASLTMILEAGTKTLTNHLYNRDEKIHDKLANKLWEDASLGRYQEADDAKSYLQRWLSQRIEQIENLWSDSKLVVHTPQAYRLLDDLEEAGFYEELSKEIHQRLLRTVKLTDYQIKKWGHLPKPMRSRQVTLSWATKQIAEPDERAYFQEMLDDPRAFARLQVEFPNVGLWSHSGVPVVLYSGKMARDEREGLIRLFDELDQGILVSTSAVEVGVDFDADVLITEQCPGPDLIQRFGRIGRREDIQGRVILQLHDRQAYFQLRQQLQEIPALSREMFSEFVTRLFPPRRYLSGSVFLEATHWLINDQLGRIGQTLNQSMFSPEVAHLATEIRRADLSFAFGLRGTMPQVGLRNGVTLSPFYALRKIYNDRLWPSDSPFELVRADIVYNQFVYQRSEWEVTVDLQQTIRQSQALFYLENSRWQVCLHKGIAQDYVSAMGDKRRAKAVMALMLEQPKEYEQLVTQNPDHLIARLGLALKQLETDRRTLLLGFGDVYLKRLHREGITDLMEDMFGTPLRLRDQTWLVIVGDVLNTKRHLNTLGFNDVEELVQVECDSKNMILVESMVGATFQVYEKWGSHLTGG